MSQGKVAAFQGLTLRGTSPFCLGLDGFNPCVMCVAGKGTTVPQGQISSKLALVESNR